MSLDECFAHELWPAFTRWLSAKGLWLGHWVYSENEQRWRPYWECFLAGVAAENIRILELT